MFRRSLKYIFYSTLLTIGLSSCLATKKYQAPQANTQSLYRDAPTTDTSTIADLQWKQVFTDPNLQQLINEGLAKNYDLQIAVQQMNQAESYFLQSKSVLFPAVTANASGSHYTKPVPIQGNILSSGQFQLTLNASWEADIWGKLTSSRRAAYASLLQSEEGRRAVQTRLVSDIATAYYTLLALDSQLVITKATVQNRIASTNTIQALKDADRLTGAAVVQSEANRYAAEILIPDLEQNIRQVENSLSILLGRAPGPIARGRLSEQKEIDSITTGVPMQLLRNRPDVMAAEYQFMHYFELTNVARTYFYPSLTISATGGLLNTSIEKLFDPSSLYMGVVGGLLQPIFSQRANKTRLEVAKAQQEISLIQFKTTLLNAGNEVSTALGSYQSASDKVNLRVKEISSLQKSVDYTMELLNYGNANYTEVLTAQQNLLAAQLNGVNDRLQQLNAIVTLYRALGGGWK